MFDDGSRCQDAVVSAHQAAVNGPHCSLAISARALNECYPKVCGLVSIVSYSLLRDYKPSDGPFSSSIIHVLYILFCLFVGCGGEIKGGGLEEEYVTAKSSQVLFTTAAARLAGKMRIGIGLSSCSSSRG